MYQPTVSDQHQQDCVNLVSGSKYSWIGTTLFIISQEEIPLILNHCCDRQNIISNQDPGSFFMRGFWTIFSSSVFTHPLVCARSQPVIYLFLFTLTSVFPQRLFTSARRRAHTQSAYGGGRFKAIIIHPRICRDNGGSVKAFSQKAKKKKHSECQRSTKTPLAESCFEARCAGRPPPPAEAGGRGCGRILHPNRHKRLTLTLFRASSARLCCAVRVWAYMHVSLYALRVYLQLLSALSHQIVLANFLTFLETGSVPRLDRGGISQECASRRLSRSFLCCQPEWNVMSCQDDCEAISELSGVRSATFVVAGSWCLPGAMWP